MRLKPGKICNSLSNFSLSAFLPNLCCFWFCRNGRSAASNASSNKMTFKKEAKLIYYTFFYNHHNDSLTAIETFLYPFVNAVTHFIKILGYVKQIKNSFKI